MSGGTVSVPWAIDDWTVDRETNRCNSSEEFETYVRAVTVILNNHRLGSSPADTARFIMAQLAHVHGLAPRKKENR